MDIPFFSSQIDLLYFIAALRSEWLDHFFLFLNYFDTQFFLMVLIPFVWIGISSLWGLRISLLLIFSTLLNYHLKLIFDLPRPIVDFPNLAMLPFTDPGFPSGGAQTAALLGGLLIYAWKSLWAWPVAILYMLLIPFSRLYLGVHYPMDVLGGFILGLAICFAYIYSLHFIDKFCRTQGRGFCVILCLILAFLYSFLLPSPKGYRLMAAFLGFALGAYVSYRFRLYPVKKLLLSVRISNGITAIVGIFFLYMITPSYTPEPIQAFILALWVSLLAAPFCRAITPKRASAK